MQQQNNNDKNQFDFWNDENGEMNIYAEKIQGIQDYDELLSFVLPKVNLDFFVKANKVV